MRSLIALATLALASCATVPATVHPGDVCDATGSGKFVGQPGTSENGAAILAATHSSILRWATPGMMMTMEFSARRVTVRLGPDGRIVSVDCG